MVKEQKKSERNPQLNPKPFKMQINKVGIIRREYKGIKYLPTSNSLQLTQQK